MKEATVKIISDKQAKLSKGYPLYIEFKNAGLPIMSMGQTGYDILRDAMLSYLHYTLEAIPYNANEMVDTYVRYAEYFYHCQTADEQEKIMMLLRGMVFDEIDLLPVETGRKSFLAEEIFSNIREIIEVGMKHRREWEN